MILDILNNEKPFKLSDQLIEKYSFIEPKWGPLGYLVFKRTYARPIPELGRTEEWFETVKRVVEGTYTIQQAHCRSLNIHFDVDKAMRSAMIMYDKMFNFKFLPPGRGLWMMGTKYVYERGSACLNNCGFISSKYIKDNFSYPFVFLMDMGMLGVGVGFDTKGAGTVSTCVPQTTNEPFVVPDSREGWVNLIQMVLDSFIGKGVFPNNRDYSRIRPKGSPLKGFGGTASGPDPLERLVQDLYSIFVPKSGIGTQRVTSTHIVDAQNAIAKCIISGNIRRVAEIALGDPNDTEFSSLKNHLVENPYPEPEYAKKMIDGTPEFIGGPESWRWASNNSILADLGMDYSSHAEHSIKTGEPGYVWLDNCRAYGRMGDPKNRKDECVDGINPCGEQPLFHAEMCCLVENFPSLHDSKEEFIETLKYSYLYAKTVTLVPTHHDRTNAVMLKNRRIGSSLTGVVDTIQKIGINEFKDWCEDGYNFIGELDREYSNWLCIRESIKTTSVKPSGSVSLLPGVTPGIHFPHAKYYIRRVRLSDTSELIEQLKNAGYHVEKDDYSVSTMVVEIPVEEKNFYRSKLQVSLWEQMSLAAFMQRHWSDNSVSVTVTFQEHEKNDIEPALNHFQYMLKAVSFLPLMTSKETYSQLPYEEIDKSKYEEMSSKIKPMKLTSSRNESVDRFCDGDKCEVVVGKKI